MSSLTICWTLLLIYSWIVWNDNDVNEDVSQRLAESRSAGNSVRRSQSSFSEILTTGVGRKNLRLKIACWIVRTLLEKGKLENVKQEMAQLGLNVLGVSQVGLERITIRVTVSEQFSRAEKSQSSNNIRQKNIQLCIKGTVWGWQTVDGKVKRDAGRHVHQSSIAYMPTPENIVSK